MRQYTQLYKEILPAETGLETGFMDIGFNELACDDRLEAHRETSVASNRLCEDVQEITPANEGTNASDRCADVLAGFYVAADGRANPTDTTVALAKGAQHVRCHHLNERP
jgi:4-methylaminobutanoate oxidase (formaldehyde-forming)